MSHSIRAPTVSGSIRVYFERPERNIKSMKGVAKIAGKRPFKKRNTGLLSFWFR